MTLGMRIVSTGQRAHGGTASFPRRSASANDDRRACRITHFHYLCRSPIDLRASTSSSTSFRVKKSLAASILISSRVHDGSDTSKRYRYATRACDLLSGLVLRMKKRDNAQSIYFKST